MQRDNRFVVSIVGTKGITGVYGGFETMAKFFAKYANELNYELHIFGYNTGFADDLEFVVEHKVPLRSFLFSFKNIYYDVESYRMASKLSSAIIVCGYSAVPLLMPFRKVTSIVNTDGIEWKRKSYNRVFRIILKLIERLIVKLPFTLVSDSYFIQSYYHQRYGKETVYIPYGMDEGISNGTENLAKYGLIQNEYFTVSVRISIENNILMIIKGFLIARIPKHIKLMILGSLKNNDPYHNEIDNFVNENDLYHQILFIDLTNTDSDFNAIRGSSLAYIHGHSCGGTSPALVEAIGLKQFIIGYDWSSTRELLNDDMVLFKDEKTLARGIEYILSMEITDVKSKGIFLYNERKDQYSWPNIIQSYLDVLKNDECVIQ